MGATGFELGPATSRFDLVIEAAGTASAVERALCLARRGGRVVLVGLAGNGVKAALPIDDVVNNDLLISASFAYTSAAWAEVTALLSSARIRLSPLVTHRFPLEAYEEAYQVLRSTSGSGGLGPAAAGGQASSAAAGGQASSVVPPEPAEPRGARSSWT